MSDQENTEGNTGGINEEKLAAALAKALEPMFHGLATAQAPRHDARPKAVPSARAVGLDDDDPYSGQFSAVIKELANLRSQNKGLNDQVYNQGVNLMQQKLNKEVHEALKAMKVPKHFEEPFKTVIYSRIQSGHQVTPEAILSELMDGVNAHTEETQKNLAKFGSRARPPMFRGEEVGPEMPVPESMDEANELFAEVADALLQGHQFDEPIAEN